MNKIEICIVCYNYQRRLIMYLSSLVQQVDPPEFIINIAYEKGNGNPDVETIVNFFEQKGLKFKLTPYTHEGDLQRRGQIRNLQVENSTEDWLLFADCDHIYHPTYFNGLKKYMDDDCQNVIGCGRVYYSNMENTNRYFENLDSLYIESAYDTANSLGIIKRSALHQGAHGGFQLVTRKMIMEKCNGFYGNPKYITREGKMGENRTRSDRRFRSNIDGGAYKSKIVTDLPLQIHLEHYRIRDTDHFNMGMQR